MSSVNSWSILSGSWEFQPAIHFSATAASRSVEDLLSGGAAITGRTSMATRMAPVRTRFLFIFISLETSCVRSSIVELTPKTLRDYSKVPKERKRVLWLGAGFDLAGTKTQRVPHPSRALCEGWE